MGGAVGRETEETARPCFSRWSRFFIYAIASFGLIVIYVLPKPAIAEDATKKYLNAAEVKAKYQNCEEGWYSGPRPGKTRFTQDPYLWVVTPEFAKRFCMPEEFVSEDLKGAEAVAFSLKQNNDEVGCGWANNDKACIGEIVLRFDVYLKSDTQLPKRSDGTYFQRLHVPSSMLVTKTPEARKKANQERNQLTRGVASEYPFDPTQVSLLGIKGSRVEWPICTLYPETYFARIFPGVDYYAFEGSSGFFNNARMMKMGIRKFIIAFDKLGEQRPSKEISVRELPHVVELPEWYSDKVAGMDRERGRNTSKDIKEVFGIDKK